MSSHRIRQGSAARAQIAESRTQVHEDLLERKTLASVSTGRPQNPENKELQPENSTHDLPQISSVPMFVLMDQDKAVRPYSAFIRGDTIAKLEAHVRTTSPYRKFPAKHYRVVSSQFYPQPMQQNAELLPTELYKVFEEGKLIPELDPYPARSIDVHAPMNPISNLSVFPQERVIEWLKQRNLLDKIKSAIYDPITPKLIDPSASWPIVPTPERDEVIEWVSQRVEEILSGTSTNRKTTLVLLGVRANGKTLFVQSLVAVISSLFKEFVSYWFPFETGFHPRLLYTPDFSTPLVLGVDELGELRREPSVNGKAAWRSISALMKRDRTICLVAATDQWELNFSESANGFAGLDSTVVHYHYHRPLATIDRYRNFFDLVPVAGLGLAGKPGAVNPQCFSVIQYWTGGRLGFLFELQKKHVFTKENMETPQILHESLKTVQEIFYSRPTTKDERNFEKRIAWATLGILGCPIADLPYSNKLFALPQLKVGEIQSYLHVRGVDEQNPGWMNMPLDSVIIEEKKPGDYYEVRLASARIMMNLADSLAQRVPVFDRLGDFSSDILILAGAGLSMQSAQVSDATPLDLAKLATGLLTKSGLPIIPAENTAQSIHRWINSCPELQLQAAMEYVLEETFPLRDSSCWEVVFACNRPVINENYDLHAAKVLYQRVHGSPPKTLSELKSVILTWESSEDDIRNFLEGRLPGKVLYREGSLLQAGTKSHYKQSGNWILGNRYAYAAGKSNMEMINRFLRRFPVLMIGIHGAVATTVIRQKMLEIAMSIKGQEPVVELFRLVRAGIAPVPLVQDITCEDYSKEKFLGSLHEVKEALLKQLDLQPPKSFIQEVREGLRWIRAPPSNPTERLEWLAYLNLKFSSHEETKEDAR